MLLLESLLDPCDKMVLESAFNQLVKDIRRDQLMDVRSRKVVRERLGMTVNDLIVQLRLQSVYILQRLPLLRNCTIDPPVRIHGPKIRCVRECAGERQRGRDRHSGSHSCTASYMVSI